MQKGYWGAKFISIGIALSRILGFIREAIVAKALGTTQYADIYISIFKIPNLLQVILGDQTFAAAFTPQYLKIDKKYRAVFLSTVFFTVLAVVALYSIIGVIFARQFVILLAPGYLNDTDTVRFSLTVQYARYLFPAVGFLSLASLASAYLIAKERFFLPYIAAALWNLSIIVALIIAQNSSSTTILLASAIGGIIGSIVQFFIPFTLMIKELKLSFSKKFSIEFIRFALPVVISRSVTQIGGYIAHVISTFLAPGAVSALAFAQRLFFLPLSLFATSLATSSLPSLSREKNLLKKGEYVTLALRQMALFTIPSSIIFIFFGRWLVALVFQRGGFKYESTLLVSLILSIYGVSLISTSIARVLKNLFFSIGDTYTPSMISVLAIFVDLSLAVVLSRVADNYALSVIFPAVQGELKLGAIGIATAFFFSSAIELYLLSDQLRKKGIELKFPTTSFVRFTFLSLVVALVSVILKFSVLDKIVVGKIGYLLFFFIFAILYVSLAYLLGFEELQWWIRRGR